MAKSKKVWFAIESFDFGGMNNPAHFTSIIIEADSVSKTMSDKYTLVEALESTEKQVTLTDGRKGKLFDVNGVRWVRFRDGSATANFELV